MSITFIFFNALLRYMPKIYTIVIYNALLAIGLVGLILTFSLIAHFFYLSFNFTVISSSIACEQPLNNRCEKHFQVRNDNGVSEDFVPLGEEISENHLKPGIKLVKQAHSLTYQVDGADVKWPYFWNSLFRFIGSCLCISIWFLHRCRIFAANDNVGI